MKRGIDDDRPTLRSTPSRTSPPSATSSGASVWPRTYQVLRNAATERPFTSSYTDLETEGVYHCRGCGTELFRSTEKFHSHCGWPSFFDPADTDAVITRADDSLRNAKDRGALRHLWWAPRPRFRRRGLRHPHRPALLHQRYRAGTQEK